MTQIDRVKNPRDDRDGVLVLKLGVIRQKFQTGMIVQKLLDVGEEIVAGDVVFGGLFEEAEEALVAVVGGEFLDPVAVEHAVGYHRGGGEGVGRWLAQSFGESFR